jgi:PAS domain S-box-containing protein
MLEITEQRRRLPATGLSRLRDTSESGAAPGFFEVVGKRCFTSSCHYCDRQFSLRTRLEGGCASDAPEASMNADRKSTYARRRFLFISMVFAALQLAAMALSWAAVEVINSARAFVTGESLYSKGQNAAIVSLYDYIQTGDEHYFTAFRASIQVPIGDRLAREAIDRPVPDREAAVAGLLQGRINPKDIPGLIRVYSWFRRWGPFEKAVNDWVTGDQLIARLSERAEDLHRKALSGRLAHDERRLIIDDLHELSGALLELEDSFSEHVGDAAREATAIVVIVLSASGLLLCILGIGFIWSSYRNEVKAELSVKESEKRFRAYAEIASDWFWETDDALRISYLSARFARATGARPDALLGKTYEQAGLAMMSRGRLWQHLSRPTRRPAFRRVACRYVLPDGSEQYWSLSGSPMFTAEGRFLGYRGTGTDISAEIRSREALREAKAMTDIASRAKSEFIANMSHELRTPLNAIIGFSEVIKSRHFGEALERYVSYASDIHSSATHLLSIINDILDMSKIESGQTDLHEEIVMLGDVIYAVVKLLRQKIELASLSLSVTLAPGLPPIRGDARKLKQIVMNLLSNSVKFTPAGGDISITAGHDAPGNLRIEIRDTGIGMRVHEIPKALAPFGQVDSSLARKHEGTGLGLPLVKALTELHGGSFTLSSEPGRGTIAVVILPRQRFVLNAAE